MKKDEDLTTEIKMENVKIRESEIEIEAKIKVRFQISVQDKDLPNKMAANIDEAGQRLKRELLREGIERADREVVLAKSR